MPDPLTALGVASNVIQLVDFAWRLVSDSRDIYLSSSGLTQHNAALDTIAQDMAKLNNAIASSKAIKLDPSSDTLKPLITESNKIASDLIAAISSVRHKAEDLRKKRAAAARQKKGAQDDDDDNDDGEEILIKRTKWYSFLVALGTVWKKNKIEEFVDRLGKIQAQVSSHMTFIIL
jgi:hypothetical protein